MPALITKCITPPLFMTLFVEESIFFRYPPLPKFSLTVSLSYDQTLNNICILSLTRASSFCVMPNGITHWFKRVAVSLRLSLSCRWITFAIYTNRVDNKRHISIRGFVHRGFCVTPSLLVTLTGRHRMDKVISLVQAWCTQSPHLIKVKGWFLFCFDSFYCVSDIKPCILL